MVHAACLIGDLNDVSSNAFFPSIYAQGESECSLMRAQLTTAAAITVTEQYCSSMYPQHEDKQITVNNSSYGTGVACRRQKLAKS
jgi:hypothetical protein